MLESISPAALLAVSSPTWRPVLSFGSGSVRGYAAQLERRQCRRELTQLEVMAEGLGSHVFGLLTAAGSSRHRIFGVICEHETAFMMQDVMYSTSPLAGDIFL